MLLPKRKEKGLTIIELMITLMVAVVVFCLSTPLIYYTLKKNKEDQTLEAVTSGLANARLRAIHQNASHTVTFDNSRRGYSIAKSAEPDKTLEQGNWGENYSLAGADSVQFDSLGRPAQTGTWELITPEQDKYIITVDHSGKIHYTKKSE